jgi:hypothetical protein
LQNSPPTSSCFFVALIENYSTSKLLKDSPDKSQILSYDTVAAKEGCVRFQVFPAMYIGSAFFWDVAQGRVVFA